MIFSLLLSFKCFAYITIPGMVLNDIGKTTVVNASVFLGDDSAGNNQQKLNVKYDTTYSEKVVTKLKNFSIRHITEKAYLHFDKPYYAAGDTIYFKAYTTSGERHQLSNLSGVLHIDLINTTNKVDQSIKLQLVDGVGWGDFALPDSLPEGNYRVRAYTRWMRNEGETAFFEQNIPIGSVLNNKILESVVIQQKGFNTNADMQFFPEGGSLVTGLRSKVAFKAIGADGLGINVNGVILDSDNKEICSFSSSHFGMGYFYINPAEGKTYKAKLIYPNGSQDVIDLQKPEGSGIVLSVNNDSIPKASVRIEANKAFYQENKNKVYTLLIYSGGIATTVSCKLDSQITALDILKRHLHTGVAIITLFSPKGEPLCERLIFIQTYNQLNLTVSCNKTAYTKREKVQLNINARTRTDSAAIGHFSVSVIDENKVPINENKENTILSNLLLTSDLKGYIEQPNYYFTNTTDKTGTDLDLVMLTHGYRRFEWKQLLNNGYMATTYQREKGLEIAGVANTLTGKPLADGVVSLISPKGGALLTMQTDNKGEFLFSDLAFTDSARFILQAVNAKGKNTTQLFYNKDTPLPVTMTKIEAKNDAIYLVMQPYLDNREKQLNENYGPVTGRMLKVVNIRERKRADDYRSSNPGGPGHADQVIHAKEIEMGGGSLSHRLLGHTRGIQWMPAGSGFVPVTNLDPQRRPMSIILDGQPVQKGFTIDDINPANVETVEILMGASESIYGINGGGTGILVVTTKQGGRNAHDIPSAGILPITVTGFYKAREFYSPKYEHPDDNINRKDLRSTIYWKPEIVTDKDGNASFEYYNADDTGTYKVVIEGIDKDGNIGRQVYRYKVQ